MRFAQVCALVLSFFFFVMSKFAGWRWGCAESGCSGPALDSRAPRLPLQCWEVRPSAAGHIKGSDAASPVGARQEQLHNESCARCGVRKKTPISCAFPAPPRTCQAQVATGSRKRHRSSQILWFHEEMASLNAPAEGGAHSVGGVWLEAEEHMDGFIVTDEFPSWAD